MSHRRPLLNALLMAAACALLGACALTSQPPAPDVYLLPSAAFAKPAQGAPVEWSLRVATPHAGELLASSKIAVLPQPDQLNFYQGARWSDPAPVLLRDRIIDALHADGRIAALSSDADDIVADLLLTGDLRAFQSEYRDGAPHVVIRLDARLVRTKNQSITASRRFEVIEPVGATAVGDVVRAFGVASDRLASQVRDWALQQRP